ncbi:response regulator transcription factor [uncultured Spirosoma sp.]|uniref:response regulator n=1 Tax=uncultured Spirosoma sp. TaxID=278208 RepID=UPI0025863071|nr:response regulator transcription factor [uncultured Spirosoma sp.]
MFTILLVDDIQLWLDLLPAAFGKSDDIQVIGAVSTEDQLWEFLKQQRPDLLLLDIFLTTDTTDLRLARQLKQTYPELRIVLLTSANSNVRLIQEANQLGLDGYISKYIGAAALLTLIDKARRGERIFSEDVKNRIVQLHRQALPKLTPKEQDILTRLQLGMKRASIIADLRIRSDNTYDVHVHHLKEKLGAKTTSELLRKAAEWGYV